MYCIHMQIGILEGPMKSYKVMTCVLYASFKKYGRRRGVF
jgi:hypothetical protein